MSKESYFAEVVESSLTNWTAQSWKWDTFPRFGSFVAIEAKNRTIFGIVHQVHTGSMDPGRYPFPYQKTEEELLREQPQIFEFLKTTFSCITIGYQEKDSLFYRVSPEPPKIHSFVAYPSTETTRLFFSNVCYLHLLFTYATHVFNIDELMLALIEHQRSLKICTKDTLSNFMNTYSLLIGNDYRRTKLFLQRVQQSIK